ncbi:uncharacterized protein BYT42DRAFT_581484 [Radiomyces spectabilis]|uniref:uncharacterized protein n=1 Tax=Radiomyces spectabilis TaxID=64574 RepID=UPI00221F41ED|nr:uncharacterized protein BYT42DRAFT_581484 [Radiomyces spectabilis]KAI8371764.1 hypothetical protein BYT42DRAFT_581484 [Radiomyces spectabilis]
MTSPSQYIVDDWFYIQSISTHDVITACSTDLTSALRSQVYVNPPKCCDEELWRWDGQYIRNKATDFVLDIRKGRLRLIEDTEICLYHAKPQEEAQNQLWGVRETSTGCFIYSVCNEDWVLDIQANDQGNKLILFPFQYVDNDNQQWMFVSVTDMEEGTHPLCTATGEITPPMSMSSSPSHDTMQALSPPVKRGSQSSLHSVSLTSFKESHQIVYLERNPRLSDKTIAMAAAYQAWKSWKSDQVSSTEPILPESLGSIRGQLQNRAQTEAEAIFQQCDQLNNHKETASALAGRLVIQLLEQTPPSP